MATSSFVAIPFRMWNDDYGGKGEAAGEGGGAIKNLPFKRGRRKKEEKYQFDSNPAIFVIPSSFSRFAVFLLLLWDGKECW